MTHDTLRLWLALNQCHALFGSRRAHQLLTHFGSIQELYTADDGALAACGLKHQARTGILQPDWPAVEAAQAWAEQPGRKILIFDDPGYPDLLRQIPDPPLLLYCQGDCSLLRRQSLAIVGSRSASHAGLETAYGFAAHLASLGWIIISGMALGIDAAAHRGALDVQGATVAVVGTGLDRVYPPRHQALAAKIGEHGLLISELPLGTPPLARHFPQRNRIISGLARGVLVVEAGIRSGSLITAHQAAEQGREVFAIPGSIQHPNSKGCHKLLREGAKLVDSVSDILEEFAADVIAATEADADLPPPAGAGGGELELVLAAVDTMPISVEHIVERSGLTPDVVCSMLLILEMQEFVHITSDGQYCRALARSRDERKHP